MRGNGLNADRYVAIADLDPGTADALLLALRDRGVAAYAATSPDPALLDDISVDRLYVDVAAVEQARALVDLRLSAANSDAADELTDAGDLEALDTLGELGLGDLDLGDELDGLRAPDARTASDFDAAFADIVAGFDAPPSYGRPGSDRDPAPWPVEEDLVERRRGDRPAPDGRPGEGGDPRHEAVQGLAGGVGPTIGWEDLLRPEPAPLPPVEDEGYVPPPPPPLPRGDTVSRFAWAAVLGGPLFLFLAVLLGWHLESWMMLAAAVAFLSGFVTLVVRLGERGDDDDGAVV